MKRWIALMLLVVMMVPTAAMAASWEDGRSPSKPYVGVPEVDLDKTLGYMMFYPNSKMAAEHFCNKLMVYLPRTDAQAGKGRLYFCSEENGEELRFRFNDEKYVVKRDMTEDELNSLLWGEGVCFEITLPVSLKLGAKYFVNMERNAITANKGKVTNNILGGTESWAFTLEGEYGMGNLQYRHQVKEEEYETVLTPAPGDEVVFDVTLGGEAKMAALYCWDDTMAFDSVTIKESGTVVGHVLKESPEWGIIFMDEKGNELWQEIF